MNDVNVDSVAFRRAVLESEQRRIYGVTVFLLIFAVAITLRVTVFSSHMNPWGILLLLLLVAYEAWTLAAVKRALARQQDVSSTVWILNIVLEIAATALGIAYFSSPRLGEYRPIGTPWILAFFPLITCRCCA